MMKKQYTTPQMQVISITKPQLLAGSEQVPLGGSTSTQMAPDFDFGFEEEF